MTPHDLWDYDRVNGNAAAERHAIYLRVEVRAAMRPTAAPNARSRRQFPKLTCFRARCAAASERLQVFDQLALLLRAEPEALGGIVMLDDRGQIGETPIMI